MTRTNTARQTAPAAMTGAVTLTDAMASPVERTTTDLVSQTDTPHGTGTGRGTGIGRGTSEIETMIDPVIEIEIGTGDRERRSSKTETPEVTILPPILPDPSNLVYDPDVPTGKHILLKQADIYEYISMTYYYYKFILLNAGSRSRHIVVNICLLV